jgi:hypothetical protein
MALGFVEEVKGGMGHELARDREGFTVRGLILCMCVCLYNTIDIDHPHNPPYPKTNPKKQYLTLPPPNEDTALLLRARKLLQEVAASVQLDIGPVRI